MENVMFIPNRGRVPSAESLPTLLQKPVALLDKLPCVAGVISGLQQADHSTMLMICFRAVPCMDYKQALQCFNVPGLKVNHSYVNMDDRFLKIKVSPSKQFLN